MNKETFISENKTIIDTDYYLKLLNCEQENQRKLYTSNGNKFTKYELLDDYEGLLQENKLLKNNWNELRNWLLCMQEVSHLDLNCLQSVLSKMQEIESGKNE